MKHHRQSLPVFLSIVVAAMLLGAGEAQARRGFMIITTGSTHSELGPLKKDTLTTLTPGERLDIQTNNYDTVGYQYSHFGIFWLDIWNWGGEYIVYNKVSENGGIVTDEQAALLMGVPQSKLPKPLNYRMPYGLLAVVGLFSLKFVPRLLMKRKQQQQAAGNFDPSRGSTPQQPWTPPAPPAGGPPPMPPPMPPEQ